MSKTLSEAMRVLPETIDAIKEDMFLGLKIEPRVRWAKEVLDKMVELSALIREET